MVGWIKIGLAIPVATKTPLRGGHNAMAKLG